MLRSLRRRIRCFVIGYGLCFLLAARIIGGDAFPRQAIRGQDRREAPTSTSFMSIGTIDYRGTEVQNFVQSASQATIRREPILNKGIDYSLSVEGGFRIGGEEIPLSFKMRPFTAFRSASSEEINSSETGLALSVSVANNAVRSLHLKWVNLPSPRIRGWWEGPLDLSLGEVFPGIIQVKFTPLSLPFDPGGKVIGMAVETDTLSFREIGDNGRDAWIFGRYKGVLVYSQTEDMVLQCAAAFTASRGQDQIRIEQVHYPLDANGKRALVPLVDARSYLGHTDDAPTIRKEGPLPPWAVQSLRVFDVVHTAVMAQAEKSNNPVSLVTMAGSLWRQIVSTADWLSSHVGSGAARDFLLSIKKTNENFERWWKEIAAVDPKGLLKKDLINIIDDAINESIIQFVAAGVGYGEAVAFALQFGPPTAAALAIAHLIQIQYNMMTSAIENLMEQPRPMPPAAETRNPGNVGGGGESVDSGADTKGSKGSGIGMFPILLGAAAAAGGIYYLATQAGGQCDKDEVECGTYCCPEGSLWYLPSGPNKGCYSSYGSLYYANLNAAELCTKTVLLKLKK